MTDVVAKLREFCSEKNQAAIDSIEKYIDATEIDLSLIHI